MGVTPASRLTTKPMPEEYMRASADPLGAENAKLRFPFESVPIELVLRNSAGKPAETVKVVLSAPDGMSFVREAPDEPVQPIKPKLPGRPRGLHGLDPGMLGAAIVPLNAGAAAAANRMAMMNPPNVSKAEIIGRDAIVTIRVVSNFDEVTLDRLYLKFDGPAPTKRIAIRFTVRSHSLISQEEGVHESSRPSSGVDQVSGLDRAAAGS